MLNQFAETYFKIAEFIKIFRKYILTCCFVCLSVFSVSTYCKYQKTKNEFALYKFKTSQQIDELKVKYRQCSDSYKHLNYEINKTFVELNEQNRVIRLQLEKCYQQSNNDKQLEHQLYLIYKNLDKLNRSVENFRQMLKVEKQNERAKRY